MSGTEDTCSICANVARLIPAKRHHYLYQLYVYIVRPKWCQAVMQSIQPLDPVDRVVRVILTVALLLRWYYVVRSIAFPHGIHNHDARFEEQPRNTTQGNNAQSSIPSARQTKVVTATSPPQSSSGLKEGDVDIVLHLNSNKRKK